MSVFFRSAEQRSLDWGDVYGGFTHDGLSFYGRSDAALRIVPVYAAVSLIADQFAVLPMSTFQSGSAPDADAAQIATPDFLANPDPRITVLDWRYQLAVSLKLRGNAYGMIGRDFLGRSAFIRWIHPDHVVVDESGDIPVYRIGGREETLAHHGGNILHIREFVQPGTIKGLSPIAQFRDVYETAHAATGYGRNWFKNSSRPSGILRNVKGTLKPGQATEAKELFMDSTRKSEPAVLDVNWEWQKLTISPDEAQFLQTIKATATQIAAIFRVSPEDIGGEAGNSRTYSNREMDQDVFNVRTLLPLTTRVELALKALLSPGQFVKFNMDVLNRPSLMDRSKAYSENLKNGSQTLPEVRKKENRPPLTPQQIADWQAWYATSKSESESTSTSSSSVQK